MKICVAKKIMWKFTDFRLEPLISRWSVCRRVLLSTTYLQCLAMRSITNVRKMFATKFEQFGWFLHTIVWHPPKKCKRKETGHFLLFISMNVFHDFCIVLCVFRSHMTTFQFMVSRAFEAMLFLHSNILLFKNNVKLQVLEKSTFIDTCSIVVFIQPACIVEHMLFLKTRFRDTMFALFYNFVVVISKCFTL